MARHGEHVVPIRQIDPRPEHATGGRAIHQEAIDFLRPGGSGRGQLKQTFAHNNELARTFRISSIASPFVSLMTFVLSIRASPTRRLRRVESTSYHAVKARPFLWLF